MFNPFKKKKEPLPKLTREQVKTLANNAIDKCEPEDLRELAQSALEKMARG